MIKEVRCEYCDSVLNESTAFCPFCKNIRKDIFERILVVQNPLYLNQNEPEKYYKNIPYTGIQICSNPSCNEVIRSGSHFCTKCGIRFEDRRMEELKQERTFQKKLRREEKIKEIQRKRLKQRMFFLKAVTISVLIGISLFWSINHTVVRSIFNVYNQIPVVQSLQSTIIDLKETGE